MLVIEVFRTFFPICQKASSEGSLTCSLRYCSRLQLRCFRISFSMLIKDNLDVSGTKSIQLEEKFTCALAESCDD